MRRRLALTGSLLISLWIAAHSIGLPPSVASPPADFVRLAAIGDYWSGNPAT